MVSDFESEKYTSLITYNKTGATVNHHDNHKKDRAVGMTLTIRELLLQSSQGKIFWYLKQPRKIDFNYGIYLLLIISSFASYFELIFSSY